MQGDARGFAPAIGGLDARLLDAKLSPPELRTGSVSRVELIDRARASGCRVVGVTAPAGYGKTTLLAEWARTETRTVAWVSLDRFDDEPASLLSVLVAAYLRVSPDGSDMLAAISGRTINALGRAAPRLAMAFRTGATPFVLMLDDLHELRSPSCHDVLEVVISGMPRGSQIVAASRSEQPHLARLRASGDAFELGPSDLALDAVGTAQVFAERHIDLTSEQAAEVIEHTEGWPVGTYLASLISSDTNSDVVISGDHEEVADYLYRESLSQFGEQDQQFLLRTAVLDQLTAPLCEAVVGQSGGHETLRALELSGAFLIPLDRRREWYRYHELFREFLLAELRRVEPDLMPKLHLRAADWYESNGGPLMAVEHLLRTSERERCVQLLNAGLRAAYNAGHLAMVQRWLQTVGDAAIRDYPPLAVQAGWIAALTGHAQDAQRWAAVVEEATFDSAPIDGTASFESARAMFRAVLCSAGPDQMLADASLPLERESAWGGWRPTAMRLSAEAHLLAGRVDEAAALFAQASTQFPASAQLDGLVLGDAELAVVAMEDGRWEEAAERVERALAVIDEHQLHEYVLCVLTFAAAARVAVHRGDPDDAHHQLTLAMQARPSLTSALPWLAVRMRLQLAKAYRALQDERSARHLLREIDDILRERPQLGVLVDEVSAFRRALSSTRLVPTAGASPLTPAELRLLPYLQTHLTIRDIADRLSLSRNTVNSQIGSIYRKLGVSSRSAAVHEAMAIGLLGG